MLRAIAALVVAALVGVLAYFGWNYEYGTEHNVTFTVKSLDDQASGSNGHKYLVFATDGTVYQDTDSWLHGKNDSSNIYAWLTLGHTYDCPVYGYRNFLASSYDDILDGCRDITPGVPAKEQTVP